MKRHPRLAKDFGANPKVKKLLGRRSVNPLDQEEYLASMFNFQSLESLLEAFAPILGIRGNLDVPTNEEVYIHVKDKGWLPFNFATLFPNWDHDLDFILQERHHIIHDANHSCSVSKTDIRRIELVVFFYLQLFGAFVSNRFQLPWIKIDTETSYLKLYTTMNEHLKNVLISFDDLLSDDWELLE
jgi:hypothetical protein